MIEICPKYLQIITFGEVYDELYEGGIPKFHLRKLMHGFTLEIDLLQIFRVGFDSIDFPQARQ